MDVDPTKLRAIRDAIDAIAKAQTQQAIDLHAQRLALDALLVPPPPPRPTYTLTADRESVEEGQSVLFRLQTTGLQTGTKVRYDLVGSIVAADVLVPVGGVLSIGQDGSAVLVVPIAADRVTEGTEVLTCSIEAGLASASVKVIDTSVAPPPPPPPPPPPGGDAAARWPAPVEMGPQPTSGLVTGTGHDYKGPWLGMPPLSDPNVTAWAMDATIDLARLPSLVRPWRVYSDPATMTIAPHMRGVPTHNWWVYPVFGGRQQYAGYMPTLDNDGRYVSLLASASAVMQQAAASLRAGYTEPRPGVRKPFFIRTGPRGVAIGSPYITWHGHPIVDDAGVAHHGVQVPMFIGFDPLGRCYSLHKDGSLRFLGSVPIEQRLDSWINDFAYSHVDRKLMYVGNTGRGYVLRVDRRTTPWATSVLASGLGKLTSLREVGGMLYCVDNASGQITEVDPGSGAKRVVCTIPMAFWIDYDSAGKLLVCTSTRRVFRVDRVTGQIEAQLVPDQYLSKVVQDWITVECDRAGALGVKDAMYLPSTSGTNGTHVCLRIASDPAVSLGPWFGWPRGAGNNAWGSHLHVSDPHGHYPWSGAIYGQDDYAGLGGAGLLVMGHFESNAWLIVPGGNKVAMREDINASLGVGRQILHWGTVVGAPDQAVVPSFHTQTSGNYFSGLVDADVIAAMPPSDAAAFVRGGMLGSVRREHIPVAGAGKWGPMKSLLMLAHANSQAYLAEGAPYMTRAMADVLALPL